MSPDTRIIDLTVAQLGQLVDDRLRTALAVPRLPAPLLDREGLAHVLGVSAKQVDRLRAQGLPTVPVGDAPRFELERVLEWFRGRAGGPGLRAIDGGRR